MAISPTPLRSLAMNGYRKPWPTKPPPERSPITAVDASSEALALARDNVEQHQFGQRIELVHGDWFAAVPGRRFDLLVSNPPYVDPSRPEMLDDAVRRYEPAAALFTAPGDPASAYRQILAGAEAGLGPGAWLLFETGVEAAEPALALLRACPFLYKPALEPDLAGLPRYLSARLVTGSVAPPPR